MRTFFRIAIIHATRIRPGWKPLARMVAKMKLHSLAEGAALVRKEVAGA
jgi:hypothetical protein